MTGKTWLIAVASIAAIGTGVFFLASARPGISDAQTDNAAKPGYGFHGAAARRSLPLSGDAYFGGGRGTVLSPYLISTASDLWALSIAVNRGNDQAGKYFAQTATIDLAETGDWLPIGTKDTPFRGHYEGNRRSIRNLTYSGGDHAFVGLFGYLGRGAEILRLRLTGVRILSTRHKTESWVGAIAGYSNGLIAYCVVNGRVAAEQDTDGRSHTGGIAGYNGPHGTVRHSLNSATVRGGNYTGGIAGYNDAYGTIEYSMNRKVVYGGDAHIAHTGGLAGENAGLVLYSMNVEEIVEGEAAVARTGLLVGYNTPSGRIAYCRTEGDGTFAGENDGAENMNLTIGRELREWPRVHKNWWDD